MSGESEIVIEFETARFHEYKIEQINIIRCVTENVKAENRKGAILAVHSQTIRVFIETSESDVN